MLFRNVVPWRVILMCLLFLAAIVAYVVVIKHHWSKVDAQLQTQVEHIVLFPTEYNPLTEEKIVISDPRTIGMIMEGIRAAEPYTYNHPGADWRVILSVQSTDKTNEWYVTGAGDGSASLGLTGTTHGELRSTTLRSQLEAIVRSHKEDKDGSGPDSGDE